MGYDDDYNDNWDDDINCQRWAKIGFLVMMGCVGAIAALIFICSK